MDLFPIGNEPVLVTNDARPVTADAANKRAYFLSRALINRASLAAMDVANSKANFPGLSAENAAKRFSRSTKILATIALHLMMLQQTVVTNELWFQDFQILTYQHMDEELPYPRAKTLITDLGSFDRESMITKAALDACTELGISHDGTVFLVKSIVESLSEYGNTLFVLSLRESEDDLGRLLSSIINGPVQEPDDEEDLPAQPNKESDEGFLRFDI